jgi:hypothetical protein
VQALSGATEVELFGHRDERFQFCPVHRPNVAPVIAGRSV